MWQWHPVEDIRGLKGSTLQGVRILLGVTASTACYKAVDLARELIKLGARVRIALTHEASTYVTPKLFHWATGEEPIDGGTGLTEHIQIARGYDALIIAPATVNIASKLANGIADEQLAMIGLAVQAYDRRRYLIPSAHKGLLELPQLKHNLATLEEMGWLIMRAAGSRYRFPDPEVIAWWIEATLERGEDLKGIKVIVTAGATASYIDEIRMLTNPSSGKMGFYVALVSALRGADVTLILGYSDLGREVPLLHNLRVVRAHSNQEMLRAIEGELREADGKAWIIMAAAPTDFDVETVKGKLSSDTEHVLRLRPALKIASALRERFPNSFMVGFSAHPDEESLLRDASAKLQRRGFNVVFGNVARGHQGVEAKAFGREMNKLLMVTPEGYKWLSEEEMPKRVLANIILDELVAEERRDRG